MKKIFLQFVMLLAVIMTSCEDPKAPVEPDFTTNLSVGTCVVNGDTIQVEEVPFYNYVRTIDLDSTTNYEIVYLSIFSDETLSSSPIEFELGINSFTSNENITEFIQTGYIPFADSISRNGIQIIKIPYKSNMGDQSESKFYIKSIEIVNSDFPHLVCNCEIKCKLYNNDLMLEEDFTANLNIKFYKHLF